MTLEVYLSVSFCLDGKALTKIAEKQIQEELVLLLLLGEVRQVRSFQISDTGTAGAAVKNQSSPAQLLQMPIVQTALGASRPCTVPSISNTLLGHKTGT